MASFDIGQSTNGKCCDLAAALTSWQHGKHTSSPVRTFCLLLTAKSLTPHIISSSLYSFNYCTISVLSLRTKAVLHHQHHSAHFFRNHVRKHQPEDIPRFINTVKHSLAPRREPRVPSTMAYVPFSGECCVCAKSEPGLKGTTINNDSVCYDCISRIFVTAIKDEASYPVTVNTPRVLSKALC
jgi:hypothetical protein